MVNPNIYKHKKNKQETFDELIHSLASLTHITILLCIIFMTILESVASVNRFFFLKLKLIQIILERQNHKIDSQILQLFFIIIKF